jgi:hypothetical protein
MTERQVQLINDFEPSRGPTPCGTRSRNPSTFTQSISTACPRSWGPESRANASRPRTVSISGRITFYPEVIDPLSGRALPDGEEGELVFTSLTKEALPKRSSSRSANYLRISRSSSPERGGWIRWRSESRRVPMRASGRSVSRPPSVSNTSSRTPSASPRVSVLDPDGIERSAGKARRIRDHRPRG